jgi:hypothetical protein
VVRVGLAHDRRHPQIEDALPIIAALLGLSDLCGFLGDGHAVVAAGGGYSEEHECVEGFAAVAAAAGDGFGVERACGRAHGQNPAA